MAKKVWGYKPSVRRQVVRLLCRLIIFVFRINGKTIFSNEFIQMLDPKFKVKFENKEFTFRTGHGRLFLARKNRLDRGTVNDFVD